MSKKTLPFESVSRRDLLKLGVGAGVVGPLALTAGAAKAVNTNAHIVIVGAGAGGTAMANRLSRSLNGARITVIDAREKHHYQPGWTLVASGAWDKSKAISDTADWMPRSVNWVKGMVAEFDPDNNRVVLNNGQAVDYDYLIVASGLQLRYERIEGMDTRLIGQGKGIGSVYASIDAAAATNDEINRWVASGRGTGLFTLAPTAIKCAGAPLKMTFTTLSKLEATGRRDQFNVEFMTPSGGLFSQPQVHAFVRQRFTDQGVKRNDFYTLKAIDADAKKATFAVRDSEDVTRDYDFIHVVPPMTAPQALLDSPLRFQEGPFVDWMEVNRETLQNERYPNVWGIGDVMGMALNKTAASVKMQAGVLEQNILAHLQGRPLPAKHNGYTSCPLITGIGKAMLVEFGWADNMAMIPSFSFIDPMAESWTVWVMKDRMLRPAYYAMLEGKI
ncbi:NAD(P)/FAD-dependent oxidoreductase [Marinospirillum alkaliphilum]|uniref:Sulfide:quinone oxidoreductase n=1 Tax=Marinospirillum alkaliphilum DSM 21637 TaxID=1122209 RepID=A0A1K1V2V5_9GAMM|nr:FAD-dependent oxidoreductase [Marinospirillum alkaliphilum]SFX19473.1 sulfide:quinone oxidoreductase [Marinospirillum alkaliphilum DSM 21637]